MTTAHRPTFKSTMGGSTQGGNKLYQPTKQFSSRDLPGHLKLKTRRPGQGTIKENLNLDFKRELFEKEAKLRSKGSLVSSSYNEDYSSNLGGGKIQSINLFIKSRRYILISKHPTSHRIY